jgi:hypothetical protein
MNILVFLAASIMLASYGAAADVPSPSATSPAQPAATTPKSQPPAGNELKDQLNQQNKINQQKQNYRNEQHAMKRQQQNMNTQIEKEGKKNAKHRKQLNAAQPKNN